VLGRDELADLTRVFNQTTVKLQDLYENLRQSERELRTVIEVMPVFLATALPDGWCDFLSESWLDYLGFTKEQGVGCGWADTIHPGDATWSYHCLMRDLRRLRSMLHGELSLS
jgi:PAS domain S-box-containing protein